MNAPNTPSAAGFGLAGWALVAAGLAVGFWLFPLRVVGSGEYLPGDGIDNPLNNFVLEHGYRCLTGRGGAFWDIPSFYPRTTVTAWSDAHIGMQPIYAALRASGLSPEGALQGHFLVSFLLNYLAAVWALKRLGFGPFGSVAGAYLFAFGLPLVAQLNHVQLFPRFLVPLAAVFAWGGLRDPRARKLIAPAACVVGQIYLSVYLGYFLLALLVVGFAVSVVRFRRELPWSALRAPGRAEWRARGWVAAGAFVALLPLVAGHVRGLGGTTRDAVRQLAPTPGAWLTPPSAAALWPELGDTTGWRSSLGEHQLLPGFLALGALGAGLVAVVWPGPLNGSRSAVAVGAVTSLFLALLVTRIGEVWLYAPVSYLPGAGGVRALGRVVLVLLFPLGVVLAWCADALVVRASRLGSAPALAVGSAVLAILVADNLTCSPDGPRAAEWEPLRYPVSHIRARQARIADAIRRHPAPRVVYVFPSAGEQKPLGDLIVQLEAMRAAQDLGLPCVNGWSGYLPYHWDKFRTYRALLEWLTVQQPVSADELAGLVVLGEPEPDADPEYERAMRARFPPQPLP